MSSPSARSARYAVPRRSADHLRRARLVNFLHENAHRKLILISAAAGYGKTALLADFAAETEQAVAWLQLEDADRDLAALIQGVVTALQVRFPSWQSMLPRLAGQGGAQPAELGTALAREIEQDLEDYFVLVLDDFHLVAGEPAVLAFVDALLARLPAHAHLLVAGRTLPNLRFASLLAQQQVAGLSEEHLRFQPDEVQAVLQLRHHNPLPPAEVEALVANTEGWITGILLTTQLLWQGLAARLIEARPGQGPLFNYLAEEVLDQQPLALRRFLLEAAVLPEMEPQACDVVLERTDSAEQLSQAESRRLFVSAVGDEARAYQFHHLFRDFLQARLRAEGPARLRELQARAAAWYAQAGMPEAAVTYYVAAGELAEAARLAEAQAKAMFTAGRHHTLRQWAEQLAPVAEHAPRLFLYLATAVTDSGDLRQAEHHLDMAAAGYARRNDKQGQLEVDLRRAIALHRQNLSERALKIARAAAADARALGQPASEALALRYCGMCCLALDRFTEAQDALSRSADLLRGTEHRYDLALTLTDLANAHRLRGQTTQAAQAQQEALALMRAEGIVSSLANLLNNIAWDLHMLGQYEAALATYVEALDWARRGGSAAEVSILAGQADLLADLGELAQAVAIYQHALVKAEEAGLRAMVVYLDVALARQDRRAGNYIGALEWLRRAELAAAGSRVNLPLANIDGVRGMVLVEMGRLAEGRQLLEQVCAALEQTEAPIDLAQALLYRACAEQRAGEAGAAASSLARALAVAERVGYDQMLLAEVPRARELLAACRRRPDLGAQAAALLARADALTTVRARLTEQGLIAPSSQPAKEAVPELDVRALGGGQVLKDGGEIPRSAWGSQRPRELLFFLVDRMPVSREAVLATFWPDMPQSRAVANLHQTLYRLRRAIGREVVLLEDQACRLAPDLALRYDVAQFEMQARAALGFSRNDLRRPGALAAAVTLYGGDYLPEVDAPWATERRQALADLHLRVLAEYADELMNLTRYAEARQILARALAAEPLRDDLHSRLLLCLAAQGRRYEVVDHYRRYRELLRAELGLDPPAELRALYARLIE